MLPPYRYPKPSSYLDPSNPNLTTTNTTNATTIHSSSPSSSSLLSSNLAAEEGISKGLPSVVSRLEVPNPSPFKLEYHAVASPPPPPSTLPTMALYDVGNTTPRYIRMSIYSIPTTRELLTQSHLPLYAFCQPLYNPNLLELPIPTIHCFYPNSNLSNDDESPFLTQDQDNKRKKKEEPIRCKRCRSYINPFVEFTTTASGFK